MKQNGFNLKLKAPCLFILLASYFVIVLLIDYRSGENARWLAWWGDGLADYRAALAALTVVFGLIVFWELKKMRHLERERDVLDNKLNEYELLSEATGDAIWRLDLTTGKTTVNRKLLSTFGYSAEEIAENPLWWEDNIHQDDKEKMIQLFSNAMSGTVLTAEAEYRFRCADGNYKVIHDRTFIKKGRNGRPVFMIGAMRDITNQKALQNELIKQRVLHERSIIKAMLQAQEEEREHIGYNLHDNVNQLLASAKLYIDTVKGRSREEQEIMQLASGTIATALNEIRNLSHNIIPPCFKEKTLVEAISDQCNNLLKAGQFNIHFCFQSFDESLVRDDLKLNIYRIFQEQISNVVKYSMCNNVRIELMTTASVIEFRLGDDGVGFDWNTVKKGVGLLNIRKRVELFEGNLCIDSSPGNGCSLSIRFALQPRTAIARTDKTATTVQ